MRLACERLYREYGVMHLLPMRDVCWMSICLYIRSGRCDFYYDGVSVFSICLA